MKLQYLPKLPKVTVLLFTPEQSLSSDSLVSPRRSHPIHVYLRLRPSTFRGPSYICPNTSWCSTPKIPVSNCFSCPKLWFLPPLLSWITTLCFNASLLYYSQEVIPRQIFRVIVGFISCFSFLSKVYSLVLPFVQCLITAASHFFQFYVVYDIRASPAVRSIGPKILYRIPKKKTQK